MRGHFELEALQEGRRYRVGIGRGLVPLVAREAKGREVALLTARRVLATPLGARVRRALGKGALVHLLPDGERGKTLAEVERACGAMLGAGLTRGALVVALGGGAVTDAAGFAASVFLRGVEWIAVPTTLLAMVDASLGGKTAVNLPGAKNAVGAFHPPRAVVMDLDALATLPRRALTAGFGEAMKCALLDPGLLEHAVPLAHAREVEAGFVAECARLKLGIVERDPREAGERKLLNLGHTFGHAVEAAGGFARYRHGEAVAVGLAFAFRLARRLGRVEDRHVLGVEQALEAAWLPRTVPRAVAKRARALLGHDKKRDAGGLGWVLPRAEGSAWTVEWGVRAPPRDVDLTIEELST